MRHLVLERWSRGNSFLHRRDARAKILGVAAFLVILGTTSRSVHVAAAGYLLLMAAAAAAAHLPVLGVIRRAAVVLPFSLTFGAISWASGDPTGAVVLVEKSYLSALAVLILVSSTPLPQLLRGLESLGVPRFLLMVAQFLYRYLFVILEQAEQMRCAGQCRGGFARRGGAFRAAAGAVAVLFARSYTRAENIHRSMLARGFQGHFQLLANSPFQMADAIFLAAAVLLPLAARSAV